jgi:hypothetical protein
MVLHWTVGGPANDQIRDQQSISPSQTHRPDGQPVDARLLCAACLLGGRPSATDAGLGLYLAQDGAGGG